MENFMKIKVSNYIIKENSTIKQAMFKISKNKKGTVFVYREKNKRIIGSLTDGDIRAALLANEDINQKKFNFLLKLFDKAEIINIDEVN